MARTRRETRPLETVLGTLTEFSEIDPHLIDGEIKGRAWTFARARTARASTPTDDDVRDLHRAMFDGFLPWAGEFRRKDVGPGGILNVPWPEVPIWMRNFGDDLKAWVDALPADPSVTEIGRVVADAHHRFEFIHPFEDTNGRTGRVLDLYLLWVTFGLANTEMGASPIIDPFPSEDEEEEYYSGLLEADNYRPEKLQGYYTKRIFHAVSALRAPIDDS